MAKYIVWVYGNRAWYRHDKETPQEVLAFFKGLRCGTKFEITIRSSYEEMELLASKR